MNQYVLNTGALTLSFDKKNGALVHMVANKTGWQMLRRSELGLSWRLLVPVHEELRNNPIFGEKQMLSEVKEQENGITLIWRDIVSERAGTLDITVTQTIFAQNGHAVWYTSIENHSPYQVESVYSPYLGDVTRPEGCTWFKAFSYKYAGAIELDLWPRFHSQFNSYNTEYPTQFGVDSLSTGTPKAPFTLLHSEGQGLYAGSCSDSSELVAWHLEHRPGWASAIDGRVSNRDEIEGKPVHTLFAPVHMSYIQPGETRSLTPIALAHFTGGWQKGADIYREWRNTRWTCAQAPAWAQEPHAWLQLHINSPEDELRLRFTELPKVAAECADHGIKAIQLVGWNDGGQDQGNPSHSFDSRLGTFEELKTAIAECQTMGVKIILFAKFVWADRGTQWFREELYKYAVRDPYGDYYMHPGYRYFTPAQLMDINTKRLVPMCFGSDEYLDICCKEFMKLVELGADGILIDECMHHTPAQLCFDTKHGHRYGWSVYENDNSIIRIFRSLPGVPENFLIAGEAIYDSEYQVFDMSYHRSEDKHFIPYSRYLQPHAQIMTAVNGFEDRDMVNQCLLYRYVISYEPYQFKGWPHDFPFTLEYGKKMDALRTTYRKYFWDGEFRDSCGALVVDSMGKVHHPFARYEAMEGDSALVICNYERKSISVTASLEVGKLDTYCLVDDPARKPSAGGIVIPPHSAAVVFNSQYVKEDTHA